MCFSFIAGPMLAKVELKDKICAIIGAERPILLSDIKKRASEDKLSLKEAFELLKRDRALEQFAKTQQKLSLSNIHEAAENHLKTIMEKNKLSREKFATILKAPPYLTTMDQYEEEVAFQIMKNQIETSFAQSIHINERNIRKAHTSSLKKELEVFFISILPVKYQNKETIKKQNEKALAVKNEFKIGKDLESIKNSYKNQKDVSFIGPVDYKPGALQEYYEEMLKKYPSEELIGPFKDKQALTLIIRREKVMSTDKEDTGLENIRNKLYEEGVRLRLSAVTKEILENTPIEVNCEF